MHCTVGESSHLEQVRRVGLAVSELTRLQRLCRLDALDVMLEIGEQLVLQTDQGLFIYNPFSTSATLEASTVDVVFKTYYEVRTSFILIAAEGSTVAELVSSAIATLAVRFCHRT